MIVYEDLDLKKYTHFRVGGIAEKFYIPESSEELAELVMKLDNPLYIGGGSNLLINDQKKFKNVISLRRFDRTINEVNGEFIIGASVPIQKIVNVISKHGYGGIEYLYSVPALLGGAIVMNAGRGGRFSQCISDYVISVKVLTKEGVRWINKNECQFEYRDSIFKKNKAVVLAVKFRFVEQEFSKTEMLKKQRLQYCKKYQDDTNPNFGTVFCEANSLIMNLMRRTIIGKGKNVKFSPKCNNWMLNLGSGNYKEAKRLIDRTILIHRVLGRKCKKEVVIWE